MILDGRERRLSVAGSDHARYLPCEELVEREHRRNFRFGLEIRTGAFDRGVHVGPIARMRPAPVSSRPPLSVCPLGLATLAFPFSLLSVPESADICHIDLRLAPTACASTCAHDYVITLTVTPPHRGFLYILQCSMATDMVQASDCPAGLTQLNHSAGGLTEFRHWEFRRGSRGSAVPVAVTRTGGY